MTWSRGVARSLDNGSRAEPALGGIGRNGPRLLGGN